MVPWAVGDDAHNHTQVRAAHAHRVSGTLGSGVQQAAAATIYVAGKFVTKPMSYVAAIHFGLD